MRAITIRVEDELLLDVKRRVLEAGVTVQEVGERLFRAYVSGNIKVRALTEGGGVPSLPSSVSAGGAGSSALAVENDIGRGSRGPAVGNTQPSRAARAPEPEDDFPVDITRYEPYEEQP